MKDILRQTISNQGILPLYFYKDCEVSIEILRAIYRAGIRTVEYTNRGETALENFKSMRAVCDSEMKDMYLGVGTIKNAEMCKSFVDAGAHYIISPGLVDEVANVADQNKLLWVPGCMTPTEIIRAENMGAVLIKIFPGNILGPSFVSTIKELFPKLSFMPTGGVELNIDNISAWLKSGCCAVGMGSKLITKNMMEGKDYSGIESATVEALSLIQSIRSKV
jgi:2-dehydro-3-deoxyphosphogluconate aldolase/(4S)-4-hydroxy-2-oxoglutarate aldolase